MSSSSSLVHDSQKVICYYLDGRKIVQILITANASLLRFLLACTRKIAKFHSGTTGTYKMENIFETRIAFLLNKNEELQ